MSSASYNLEAVIEQKPSIIANVIVYRSSTVAKETVERVVMATDAAELMRNDGAVFLA